MLWGGLFFASELIGVFAPKSSSVAQAIGGGVRKLYQMITGKAPPPQSEATAVAGQAAGILGAVRTMAVPGIGIFGTIKLALTVLNQGIDLVNRVVKAIEKQKLDVWMDNLDKTTTKLENATTPEEKMNAAKELARLTRGLG
jgi:hypothetical protein